MYHNRICVVSAQLSTTRAPEASSDSDQTMKTCHRRHPVPAIRAAAIQPYVVVLHVPQQPQLPVGPFAVHHRVEGTRQLLDGHLGVGLGVQGGAATGRRYGW